MFGSSWPGFAALRCACLFTLAALAGGAVRAQSPAISLFVDASRAPEKILTVRESLPVAPGRISLCYPKWIQGVHAPVGPIGNLAGLKVAANGKPLAWTRDLDDAYTFHVEAPAGVSKLDLEFEYLEPSGLELVSGSARALRAAGGTHHGRAETALTRELEIRNRAAHGDGERLRYRFQERSARPLPRFPADCGRILPLD